MRPRKKTVREEGLNPACSVPARTDNRSKIESNPKLELNSIFWVASWFHVLERYSAGYAVAMDWPDTGGGTAPSDGPEGAKGAVWMSGVLERTLGILEVLAAHPEGKSLGAIAEKLNIPLSAAHRLLAELSTHGYVKQLRDQGEYGLSTKLVAMVLDYMGAAGIVDFAQPVLDKLAQDTGEFIRLAVIEGQRLTWVARAQGAHRGLRYDPEVDTTARLSCTATGHAWLMTMSDDDALMHVAQQGFGKPGDYGPKAPTSPLALLELLKAARQRGYGMTHDMFGPGLASMAVPVRRSHENPVGIISVAGPSVRLTPERFHAFLPLLLAAAHEIAVASASSPLFASRRLVSTESGRMA
jgi:IclR family transcriptional regulator, acetate operon repressor